MTENGTPDVGFPIGSSPKMPNREAAHLRKAYRDADSILEYGSGASTKMAAMMTGKRIFSVESDHNWFVSLNNDIQNIKTKSDVLLSYVDIGETGEWGRPICDAKWQNYYRYPTSVWTIDGFLQPDLIVIDGRFRCACLMTAMLMTKAPVKILFDDYFNRPSYRAVEELVRPVRKIGRMAEFHVAPDSLKREMMPSIISYFFDRTVSAEPDYSATGPLARTRHETNDCHVIIKGR